MKSPYKNLLSSFTLYTLIRLITEPAQLSAQGLDSHVHGNAQLNVALVENRLQIEFLSPAINLLGFEHRPNSEQEIALFNNVKEDLENSKWIIGNAMSGCQATTVVFEVPEFETGHTDTDESHSHDEGDSHGDFRVEYLVECSVKPARKLPLNAFSRFPALEQITVQWISEVGQGLVILTQNETTLNLE